MPAEKPTTPDESTPKASPEEHWNVLEGRTGGTATGGGKSAPPQIKAVGTEEKGPKHLRSRRTRFGVAAGLAALVVALASIGVATLVGRDHGGRSRPRSRAVHAKRREAEKRRSGRAGWVKEAGGSPRPRQGRTGPRSSRTQRATPGHDARPAALPRPRVEVPTQPPESVAAPPEQPSEPSAPAPADPSARNERPGLRDGATESTEFGL